MPPRWQQPNCPCHRLPPQSRPLCMLQRHKFGQPPTFSAFYPTHTHRSYCLEIYCPNNPGLFCSDPPSLRMPPLQSHCTISQRTWRKWHNMMSFAYIPNKTLDVRCNRAPLMPNVAWLAVHPKSHSCICFPSSQFRAQICPLYTGHAMLHFPTRMSIDVKVVFILIYKQGAAVRPMPRVPSGVGVTQAVFAKRSITRVYTASLKQDINSSHSSPRTSLH